MNRECIYDKFGEKIVNYWINNIGSLKRNEIYDGDWQDKKELVLICDGEDYEETENEFVERMNRYFILLNRHFNNSLELKKLEHEYTDVINASFDIIINYTKAKEYLLLEEAIDIIYELTDKYDSIEYYQDDITNSELSITLVDEGYDFFEEEIENLIYDLDVELPLCYNFSFKLFGPEESDCKEDYGECNLTIKLLEVK